MTAGRGRVVEELASCDTKPEAEASRARYAEILAARGLAPRYRVRIEQRGTGPNHAWRVLLVDYGENGG